MKVLVTSPGFVAKLASVQTLRNLFFFAAGGVAFAAANLVLARVLSAEQYALVALLVALSTLGCALGPVGLDGVALREPRTLPAWLMIGVPALASLGLAVVSARLYELTMPLAATLWVAAAATGTIFIAAAHLQRDQRFGHAIALTQSPNIVLICATAVCLAIDAYQASIAFTLMAVGLVVAAATGLNTRRTDERPRLPVGLLPWRESLALGGASVSTMVLIQLERLAIPQVLSLVDLALFGVLGAFAGSLYRMLQTGVGYGLLPKLRAAVAIDERRRLIGHDAKLAVAIVVAGSLAIFALAPIVEHWVLDDKYRLSPPLLVATVVSGTAKIADSFVKSIGVALATSRELAWINAVGFLAVVIAAVGALLGARFGLVGLIYGVATGWQFRAVVTYLLVAKHLRVPNAAPAAAPGCTRTLLSRDRAARRAAP
jgi:O-antigen/teichoic acid export membrane protein